MALPLAAPLQRLAARGVYVTLAAAAAAGMALQCTPSGLEASPRPSLLESTAPLERQTSPAEWRYHPRQPARLARAYSLPLGAKLFVGELGERWLVESKAERALPASILAPEALVGALPPRGAGWTFVGESGTTYDAESPLGPFLASSAPLERMARVDSGEGNLLGVSRTGQLLSSQDGGGRWHAVGPDATRFADVLLVPPHALALAVPERIWWSADEGVKWQPLDVPPFGAQALERDEEAGPIVVSALGAYAVRFDDAPAISALSRGPRLNEPDLEVPPREGPSAKALAAGHAFINAGRYFEVELGVRAEVISGEFAGKLTRQKLPSFSPCQDIRVAGFGAWVYAACTRERGGPTRTFEFFRSDDGGESFERENFVARGSDQAKLAAGDEGALIATGFCLPEENLPGCRPRGILMRRSRADAGTGNELHAVPAPALEDHALALTFSTDGRTAYAVGQRTKSESLFMFVARDLTTGFDARPITRLEGEGTSGTANVTGLAAANDGQVSLVFAPPSGPTKVAILDARGQTLSFNAAPIENATVGAYGARALAVSADEAWESLNGGASWESIGRLPRSPCQTGSTRCAAAVQCQAGGCAIGDSSSRVGWRGQARAAAALLSPAASSRSAPRRSIGKAFACELSDAEWRALRGVERLPDASQAALGKVAWYALSSDDATAAVGLWLSDYEFPASHDGIRYSELLAPKERPSETAYVATLQVEGAAAIRYAVPGTPTTSSTHLENIEVAWENLLDGQRGRGHIRDAGPFLPGDFAKGDGAARRAQTDLVSIASGGIYVRPHKNPQHQQITYFLDGTRAVEVPPLRWPTAPKGASSEMARIGGQDLALLFVNQGATVVRGRLLGDSWRFDAMSVGFAEADDFALRQHRDIAYIAGQAGIHLALLGAAGQSDARVYPFQVDGAVFGAGIAVPTQADLHDAAPSCSSEQRVSTPRIVAPHQPGARRPVVVHDPVEPLRLLLTDMAILHGTPERACAMVFDADTVRTGAAAQTIRERALIATRGPSFLFRASPDPARRDARVEYRRMQCRLDPSIEVPPDVYEMPGTRVEH